MAQKRTPSRAQRRTPRVRCFVSVAAMQQSAHFIAAVRPTSAPRAALLPAPPNADARAALASRTRSRPPWRSPSARAHARAWPPWLPRRAPMAATRSLSLEPPTTTLPCRWFPSPSSSFPTSRRASWPRGVTCSVRRCRRACSAAVPPRLYAPPLPADSGTSLRSSRRASGPP